jgi:hypothetical protein
MIYSCDHYNMGFSNFADVTFMNVTGEDMRGHQGTWKDKNWVKKRLTDSAQTKG